MRNVWKGLIVGGLTGVAAGVVLDSLSRASKTAVALGDQVRDLAPDAGRWVHNVTDKAGEWLHDADLPDHVRIVAQRVRESDAASRAVGVGNDIASVARQGNAKSG